jgi:hypothetical protein
MPVKFGSSRIEGRAGDGKEMTIPNDKPPRAAEIFRKYKKKTLGNQI